MQVLKLLLPMYFVLLVFFSISLINGQPNAVRNSNIVSCLSYVPDDYERDVSPEGQTMVEFEYRITNFDVVDVQDYVSTILTRLVPFLHLSVLCQSFTVRINLILTWNDSRLVGSPKLKNSIMIDDRHHNCYWKPDIRATELKGMRKFHEDMTGAYLFIRPSGLVVTSTQYRFIVSCAMDLSLYPMDIQRCSIVFFTIPGSGFLMKFGKTYTGLNQEISSDLTYDIIYFDKRENVESQQMNRTRRFLSSDLKLVFVFGRRLPLYLMTTYFPSSLVTVVSFTSFWISPEAVPGRVTLGVTCLLALMTQMVSVRSHIMNVNYMTAIDIWFIACITFVAFSLFGFAVSYTSNRNQKIQYKRVNVRNPGIHIKLYWKLSKYTIDQWSRFLFPAGFGAYVLAYSLVMVTLIDARKWETINRRE